ncbi:MAG TPA: plasmid stabilization protein [Candidatus Thermoplasmatota archaeon]|nr:plasmid stabilization protein [Candidatus Thermoplasmatota archaeon]
MPRGDKGSYTDKQKRQAEHIEDSAKKRGRSTVSAERIAWATVNKRTGGGRKSGSGRGNRLTKATARGSRPAATPRRTRSRSTGATSQGGRPTRTRSSAVRSRA